MNLVIAIKKKDGIKLETASFSLELSRDWRTGWTTNRARDTKREIVSNHFMGALGKASPSSDFVHHKYGY